MTPTEHALCLQCEGETLVGVLAQPVGVASAVGVIIVVGGPQYRVGSHRQFVQLARACATAGFATFRFDCRGMGDSSGMPRGFEQMDEDIEAAVTALLHARPALQHVVLCGLCDGASAALIYMHRRRADARIAGLCLINPWVRTVQGQAATRVRHYYLERLRTTDFWRKLLVGGVARGALGEALGALRAMRLPWRGGAISAGEASAPLHFAERMARGAASCAGPILLLLSGRDYTAREFQLAAAQDVRWRQVLERDRTQQVHLPEADHTFSASADQRELERHCVDWLLGVARLQGSDAARTA